MKPVSLLHSAFLLFGAVLIAAPAHAANCEDLARLSLPGVTIDSAQLIAAGTFSPPPAPRVGAAPEENGVATEGRGRGAGRGAAAADAGPATSYKSLPSFCR